jgi:hypothetical protein
MKSELVEQINLSEKTGVEADILNKAEELRKLCDANNRQCLVFVDSANKFDGSFAIFWSMANKNHPDLKESDLSNEIWAESMGNLLYGISSFISQISEGKLIVVESPK